MNEYRIKLVCWSPNKTNNYQQGQFYRKQLNSSFRFVQFETDKQAEAKALEMWNERLNVMKEVTILDGIGNRIFQFDNFKDYKN